MKKFALAVTTCACAARVCYVLLGWSDGKTRSRAWTWTWTCRYDDNFCVVFFDPWKVEFDACSGDFMDREET